MKTKFTYILLLPLLVFCINSCSKDDDDNSTCVDGIQNQGETSIDCGGPCPACVSPTCSDGIQNQGETEVDCGGPCAACGQAPSVTTGTITNITGTSATCSGIITSTGSEPLIASGVCWSTSSNPTIADQHTIDFFSTINSPLTHLNLNTTHYVRAYATNSVGTGYGAEVNFTTASVLSFGDFYAGGLVFYLDATGLHGYVCSETDQNVNNSWGCNSTDVPGAAGVVIGTGWANTESIRLAGCANGYAAQACYDLMLNGYNDWFLPSQDELHSMYVNLHGNSIGNFSYEFYWSSTESGISNAKSIYFSTGTTYTDTKTLLHRVRAARAF